MFTNNLDEIMGKTQMLKLTTTAEEKLHEQVLTWMVPPFCHVFDVSFASVRLGSSTQAKVD